MTWFGKRANKAVLNTGESSERRHGSSTTLIESRLRGVRSEDVPDMEEEAEATLVAVLEERENIRRATFGREDSSRAVLGAVPPEAADLFERPRLGSDNHARFKVDENTVGGDPHDESDLTNEECRPRLVDIAMRVRSMNRLKVEASRRNLGDISTAQSDAAAPTARIHDNGGEGVELISNLHRAPRRRIHRRSKTVGSSPFTQVVAAPMLHQNAVRTNTDQLFDNAQRVEKLFEIPESESTSVGSTEEEFSGSDDQEQEGRENNDEEVGTNETAPLRSKRRRSRRFKTSVLSRLGLSLRRRQLAVMDILRPRAVLRSILKFLVWTVLAVMLPFLITAAVLFYELGNPEVDFLPSTVTVSWWLIFVVRQLTTLHLAMCTQYVFVDVFALRSTMSVRIVGPLFTLFAIQSAGWPYVLASWGMWDLVVLHGRHYFVKNWFFFLNIAIFSEQNPDYGFLASNLYLRILLSMVIVGVATAMKRTYLALYLGRRTFIHYKPQLERIMFNMKLLAEVADLAVETETPEFAEVLAQSEDYRNSAMSKPSKSSKWDIKFQASKDMNLESEHSDVASDDESDAEEADEVDTQKDDQGTSEKDTDPNKRKVQWSRFQSKAESYDAPRQRPLRKSSSVIKIRNLLDRWQEPENKLDKKTETPSIHDILKFRKALTFIEETHPFSLSFGRADTRDYCIRSAQRVYKHLLNYTPGESTLGFDVIGVLAYDDQGNINEEKAQALVRLFRPDKDDELSLLAFVQSCDWVYKQLRYFRASVANSILIDKVLEQMVNSCFYFILLLAVLSLLEYNPWTLLVSLSTIIVSFAFAVGPSVAKYVEGVLLIAIRRPFDIGDRIKISAAEVAGIPGPQDTWIVEDITLNTTTLRYYATNEVATVSNFSIANSRLVNSAQSPRALVTVSLLFDIKATHEQIATFRSTVEKFVKDRPRTWTAIVHFRTERIDADNGFVEYLLRLQHVKSWQETGAILTNRGELLKFCIEVGKKLGVVWISAPNALDVVIRDNRGQNPSESELDFLPTTTASDVTDASLVSRHVVPDRNG